MISVCLGELIIVTLICFNLYFSAGVSTVVVSDQCGSSGTDYSHINLLQSIFFSLHGQQLLPVIIVCLGELIIVTLICFNLHFSAGLSTVVVSDQCPVSTDVAYDQCASSGTGYSHQNLLQSIFFSWLVNSCCV